MTNTIKPKTKIKLGLIGASNIAAKVLPFIRRVPEIEIVAVAAERKDVARNFAKTHSIETAYDSYKECLDDSRIDAVYISNLTSDHAKTIKMALIANKHVICEKPLVLTHSDAKELFALAESKKLILLEGFMYRFHPQILKLKEIIASGELGEIKSIRANFSFILYDLAKRPRRMTSVAGGGALFDIGCYLVDFINSVVGPGQFPIEIKKTHRVDPDDPNFDFATAAVLKYQSGVIAELSTSLDMPNLNQWEVSGTRGSVSALRFDSQGDQPVPIYLVNDESEATLIQCQSINNFEKQFESFARTVLGQAPAHIQPSESIQNARLLERLSANQT